MNREEIIQRFPNASRAFIQANLSLDDSRSPAELEPDFGDAALDPEKVQGPTGQRVLVRVTSIRRRLLDQDNLCEKYHVDLCRYAGIIAGDAPDKIEIEIRQRKMLKGEAEQTLIEIFQL